MKPLYYSIIGLILFCSCKQTNATLEQALRMAGENRQELEQVLNHYSQRPADSLKLQAARFLIENMPGHYTLEGDRINECREKIQADTTTTYFTRKILEISITFMPQIQKASLRLEDVQHIKADFLIRHIDRSFEKLEQLSWLHDLPFDLFLEYILPYRVAHERLDLWIDSLEISPKEIKTLKHADNIRFSSEGVWNTPVLSNSSFYVPSNLMNELFGENIYQDCKFGAIKNCFHSLAAAFPESLECIPFYANRNGYHYWNAIRSSESKITTINGALERKASKIYRKTFSRQSTVIPEAGEYIPEFFQDPFLKDVSNEYMYTANVYVKSLAHLKTHPRYAYLCVFNNLRWQPVAISDLSQTGVEFKDMGKNLIYLPVYYQEEKMELLHYPFILNQKGEISYLVPDTTSMQKLHLTRKYPLNKTLCSYNEQLERIIIELSALPDFSHPDTLHLTSNQACTCAEHFGNSNRKYRYCRITGNIQYAEMSFIDSLGLPSRHKLTSRLLPDLTTTH